MTPRLTQDPRDPLRNPPARKASTGRIRQLLGWLGDREHQLQVAVEAAELGLWHWNPATGELVWSDRCRALLGVAADVPASFATFAALIHPDDRARVESAIDTAMRDSTAYSVEYRIVLADGTVRWLHSLGRARSHAARSTPSSMSGVVRDVTANHRAAEAWTTQRHYLQQLLQAAPMGVASFDRQLRFQSANQAFIEGLRLGEQALTGRHLYEVLPEVPPSWRAELERGLAGTTVRKESEPFARADGSVDWVARQIHPWHDEHNELGGILLVADVSTQRRHTESQQRLRANAYTHNAHGVAIIDPLTLTLHCANAAYARLLGRTTDQLAGIPLGALYPESEHAGLQAALARADATGCSSVELSHRHQDGTLVPTRVNLVSVQEAVGARPCQIATITDSRERLQEQLFQLEALRAVDLRFRLLADAAPLAIALADPDGVMTYANPAWLALTAMPAGQALGRDWFEFVHPDDRERVKSSWLRWRDSAGPAQEFRYRRPGGELRWVQSNTVALKDTAGQTLGYLRASLDITDSLQERASADRVNSQVRALAQRLQQLRDVERNEIAGALQEQVFKGLSQLTAGLRELSQAGVPESTLRATPQRLATLAAATLDSVRNIVSELTPPGVGELGFEGAMQRLVNEQADRTGTKIVLSLPDQPLRVHQWTLCVLHEVAREALANASVHARATRIDVNVELRGDTVRMRVRDNGPGMSDKDRNKPGCFGLLAASERLAQISGTLRVVSVRDQGTTIEASAPLGQYGRAPDDPGHAP